MLLALRFLISFVYLLSPSLGDAFFGLYSLAEAKGLFLYINFKEVKLPLSLENPIVKLLLICNQSQMKNLPLVLGNQLILVSE